MGYTPTLMIVDDDPDTRRLVTRAVKRHMERVHRMDVNVVQANGPTEALGLLEATNPCLVLTDVHMGGIHDGFWLKGELLRRNFQGEVFIMSGAHPLADFSKVRLGEMLDRVGLVLRIGAVGRKAE